MEKLGKAANLDKANLVQLAADEVKKTITTLMPDIQRLIEAAREDSLGAVAAFSRKDSQKIHIVALGDVHWPTDLWHTECGWKFARARHCRMPRASATCAKCLKAHRNDAPLETIVAWAPLRGAFLVRGLGGH